MTWRILSVMALVLALGCGPKKKATEPTEATEATEATETTEAANTTSSSSMTEHRKAVEKELKELGVSVKEMADEVILEGTVKSKEAKDHAEEIARDLSDRVTSAIEVLTGNDVEPVSTPTPDD